MSSKAQTAQSISRFTPLRYPLNGKEMVASWMYESKCRRSLVLRLSGNSLFTRAGARVWPLDRYWYRFQKEAASPRSSSGRARKQSAASASLGAVHKIGRSNKWGRFMELSRLRFSLESRVESVKFFTVPRSGGRMAAFVLRQLKGTRVDQNFQGNNSSPRF